MDDPSRELMTWRSRYRVSLLVLLVGICLYLSGMLNLWHTDSSGPDARLYRDKWQLIWLLVYPFTLYAQKRVRDLTQEVEGDIQR